MPTYLASLSLAQINEVTRLAGIKADKGALGKYWEHCDHPTKHSHYEVWQQLVNVIDHFSPTAKTELMALMWVGQGRIGGDLSRWAELLKAADRELPGRSPKIPHLCSGETDQAMIKNGDSVRLLYPQGGRVVGFVLRGALRASGRALALHSWCASPARHVGIEWLGARRATSYGLTCQRKPLKPPCRVQHCQVLLLKH